MGARRRLLRVLILALIAALAFTIRLFSVRDGSAIREFDPHFNYRATLLLVERGPREFWDWWDAAAWYPLGRAVGATVYPALMLTAGLGWLLGQLLLLPLSVLTCCAFLAPACASITCLATYALTRQIVRRDGEGAGLCAAAFVAVVPAYLSRSCAGDFDNEGVAIPAMVGTFALYCRALNEPGGSVLWATLSALAYGYMVASWGGYVFVTNLIAAHCTLLLLCGRYSRRLYIAYSVWYALGGLAAMQTPFVAHRVVGASEHLLSHCAFILLQACAAMPLVPAALGKEGSQRSEAPKQFATCVLVLLAAVCWAVPDGWVGEGRLARLIDPVTSVAASTVNSVVRRTPVAAICRLAENLSRGRWDRQSTRPRVGRRGSRTSMRCRSASCLACCCCCEKMAGGRVTAGQQSCHRTRRSSVCCSAACRCTSQASWCACSWCWRPPRAFSAESQ